MFDWRTAITAGHDAFVKVQKTNSRWKRIRVQAIKHQSFVGAGYFDAVRRPSSRRVSTSAMKGSTEEEQSNIELTLANSNVEVQLEVRLALNTRIRDNPGCACSRPPHVPARHLTVVVAAESSSQRRSPWTAFSRPRCRPADGLPRRSIRSSPGSAGHDVATTTRFRHVVGVARADAGPRFKVPSSPSTRRRAVRHHAAEALDPFGNPQIDPIKRDDVAKFYANFSHARPLNLATRSTSTGWRRRAQDRIPKIDALRPVPYAEEAVPVRPERIQPGGRVPDGYVCDGGMEPDAMRWWAKGCRSFLP